MLVTLDAAKLAAYGMGVDYCYTMVHKAPERVQHGDTIGPNPAK